MFPFYVTGFIVVILALSPLVSWWYLERDYRRWKRELDHWCGDDRELEDKNIPDETPKRS